MQDEERNSRRTIKVLLADDHTMFRQGLAGVLDGYTSMEVVGQTNNDANCVGHLLFWTSLRTSKPQGILERAKLAREDRTPFDTSLTPSGTQYPAIPSNPEKRKRLRYAGFANPCNTQKQPTAHS